MIKKFFKKLLTTGNIEKETPVRIYISNLSEKYLEQNFDSLNMMDILYYSKLSEDFIFRNIHRLDLLTVLKTQVLSVEFLDKISSRLPKSIKLKDYLIANKIIKDDVYLIIPISHEHVIQTGSRFNKQFTIEVISDYLVDKEVCKVFSKAEVYNFIIKSEANLQKMLSYSNVVDSKNKSIIESSRVKAKV